MGSVVGTDYVSAYTGDQIDAALGKAASYPAASTGTTGQVPTKTENGIEWATPAAGGVTSFNGRTGAVVPEAGDYTAQQIAYGSDGNVADALVDLNALKVPMIGKGINLLDNAYFIGGGSQQGGGQFPINQRAGYIVPSGTTYYSNTALTTSAGTTSAPMTATYVNGTYGTIDVSGMTRYVAWSAALPGYTGAAYGIDRWEAQPAQTIILNENYLTIETGETGFRQFLQPIENYKQLYGKQLTLTYLFADGTIISGTNIPPDTDNTWVTFATAQDQMIGIFCSDSNIRKLQVCYQTPIGVPVNLIAIKLELGSKQTLARNIGTEANPNWVLNDPPPNFQQELAKCQRYQVVFGSSTDYSSVGIGQARTSTAISVTAALPVPMRANPAFSYLLTNTSIALRTKGTSLAPSNVATEISSYGSVMVNCTVTGATAGAPYEMFTNPGCAFILDANL